MELLFGILLGVALVFVLLRAGRWAAETSLQQTSFANHSGHHDIITESRRERMNRVTEVPPKPS